MNNQELFWEILTRKVNRISNISDSITIKLTTENGEEIQVNSYDFEVSDCSVSVMIGYLGYLTILKKSNFTYMNRDGYYYFDGLTEYLTKVANEELSELLKFTEEVSVSDLLCTEEL